ncbi:MAG: hypothetical protein ACD_21C00034G0009, partial [uncultured bacterium]
MQTGFQGKGCYWSYTPRKMDLDATPLFLATGQIRHGCDEFR